MGVADLVQALKGADQAGARPTYRLFRDYYDGRHQLRFATQKFQNDYGQLVMSLRENLCPAVVAGFTDDLALKSWGEGLQLDTATEQGLSRLLGQWVQEAWKSGDGYVIAWPNRRGVVVPHFQTAETGIPVVDPDDPARLSLYVKHWVDPSDGHGRAFLLYPDHAERYITERRLLQDGSNAPEPFPTDAEGWRPYTADGDPATIPHAFVVEGNQVVPACWLPLDSSTPGGYGRSILTDVIPLQDALNKSVADMVVLGEDYAEPFWYLLKYRSEDRARATTNPYAPSAPALPPPPGVPPVAGLETSTGTGYPQAQQRFDRRRQSLFVTSAEGPMGQLEPPDLTRLLKVQDGFALKIARTVGLPSFYVTQTSGDVPSGESLRVLATRRTGRLRRFQNMALPVLRGLGQLLGMEDPQPVWEPVVMVDELEKWQIAEAQNGMGLALEDVLDYADMPDAAEVAARARTTDARVGAALLGGNSALFGG